MQRSSPPQTQSARIGGGNRVEALKLTTGMTASLVDGQHKLRLDGFDHGGI